MGLISGVLNRIIKNKKNEFNKVNEDISALEQGIADASKSRELFKESAAEMNNLIQEVGLAFQGEAAEEFRVKLLIYSDICENRAEQMEVLVKGYKTQISTLNDQKQKAEKTISNLETWLARFKKFGF